MALPLRQQRIEPVQESVCISHLEQKQQFSSELALAIVHKEPTKAQLLLKQQT